MLLRVDFDSGKTRTGIFGDCSARDHKIILLDRVVFFERGDGKSQPSDNHAWFCWNARRTGGAPTLSYARRSP
jgi:hypothetical protein